MATTDLDVCAAHAEALARLGACREKVRGLSACLVTERFEVFEQRQSAERIPVKEWPGASVVMLTGANVTGTRRIAVDVDPHAAAEARLNLPEAIRQLRYAELAEAKLRPAVEALDAEERRAAKLRLLPKVAAAYATLDKAR